MNEYNEYKSVTKWQNAAERAGYEIHQYRNQENAEPGPRNSIALEAYYNGKLMGYWGYFDLHASHGVLAKSVAALIDWEAVLTEKTEIPF